MKGQDKTPEKQLNEVEIGKLPERKPVFPIARHSYQEAYTRLLTSKKEAKLIMMKVNQDEKVESYVPDKGTRENPRKTNK